MANEVTQENVVPRYALRDVNPVAIAVCKQGANRKRMFLRKSEEEPNLGALPMPHRILKNEDWTAFYTVVAEPGWEENTGQGGPQGVDVWDSPEEIRKAAHRLMKNHAAVNSEHQDEALGCHIVESAVALADLDIIDPEGSASTIKKDSWYVAIEPSEDFRQKVDAGEITGVSLEGDGVRVQKGTVTTSNAPSAQGSKGNDRDGSGTSQKCPNCGAKVKLGVKTCPNCGRSLTGQTGASSVAKQGALEKMWKALFPGQDMGVDADLDNLNSDTEEDYDVDRIAELEQKLNEDTSELKKAQKDQKDGTDKLIGLVENMVERLDSRSKEDDAKEPAATAASVKKSLDELTDEFGTKLQEVQDKLDTLGQGGSSQGTQADISKSDKPWHAGLLFDS